MMALSIHAQVAQRADNDAERDAALAQLVQGAERLTRLTDQLMTLARLEPESPQSAQGRVALIPLCKAVISDLIHSADVKKVDLGLSADGSAYVFGDADSLRILLRNLIDNAIRYTPSAGRIDVSVHDDDGGIVLAVCDSGPGIPAPERTRVMDRFYRGQNSQVPGNGLGLSIVKRIVDQHDAVISMDAGPDGQGLLVRVRFTCATASERTQSTNIPKPLT